MNSRWTIFGITILAMLAFGLILWYIGYNQGWNDGFNKDFGGTIIQYIDDEKEQEQIDDNRPKPKVNSKRHFNS